MKYAKPEIRSAIAVLEVVRGVYKGGPVYSDILDPSLPPFTINAYEADE